MRQLFRYAIPALLAGCASSTDIATLGQDTYIVIREESIYFPNQEKPKAEALRAATQHCKLQHRRLSVSNINETEPPYTSENPQRAEVQFMCLETGEPVPFNTR